MIRKLHSALMQYIDNNRRANLGYHTGCRQRVQDIYLAQQRPDHTDAPVPSAGRQFDDEQK